MLHGSCCPVAYFPKAAPFPQRAIQREMQRVRGKTEYVQKIALPRTIAADDHRQRPQRNIARGDALVVERYVTRVIVTGRAIECSTAKLSNSTIVTVVG